MGIGTQSGINQMERNEGTHVAGTKLPQLPSTDRTMHSSMHPLSVRNPLLFFSLSAQFFFLIRVQFSFLRSLNI